MSIIPVNIEGDEFKVDDRRNRRSKRIRLTVSNNSIILLTRPVYVSQETALCFLKENISWVKKILAKQNKKDDDISIYSLEHYLKYKEEAKKLVEEKVRYWNRFYGFEYKAISIRNQKTRWGSCSSKKNLNFNYKIIFLKEELQDYLVVHELCHLKYMDHSDKFWSTVEKGIPDHKTRSKMLRRSINSA